MRKRKKYINKTKKRVLLFIGGTGALLIISVLANKAIKKGKRTHLTDAISKNNKGDYIITGIAPDFKADINDPYNGPEKDIPLEWYPQRPIAVLGSAKPTDKHINWYRRFYDALHKNWYNEDEDEIYKLASEMCYSDFLTVDIFYKATTKISLVDDLKEWLSESEQDIFESKLKKC